jgi:hypothetical protein
VPWFKVDDGFWSHPKVLDLPASAVALWVRAGSYAAQHLTDGEVKTSTLRMLGHDEADAEALVDVGLWDGKTDGKSGSYQFHDWGRYQPPSASSKAKRDELSQKRAEAGRIGAANRWANGSQTDDKANGKSDGNLSESSDGNAMAPSRPVPSRPEGTSFLVGEQEGKQKETRLPKDWVPSAAHYELAKNLRVDVAKEADNFRLHAETYDRHAARWNAAFTTWLKKAKPSTPAASRPTDWMNR